MAQVTLGEMVKFVLDNRKGNAFVDYSEELIANAINEAAKNNTMLYCLTEDGKICGLILARADDENKIMHVDDCLTKEKWCLKSFVNEFRKRWPNYKLTAARRKKFIEYNTTKLCNKILTY